MTKVKSQKKLTVRQNKNRLAKLKKAMLEPEQGDLRGKYRPSEKEFKELFNKIKGIKEFVVKKQAYEFAAKIRDFERDILDIYYSHPEQLKGEEFLINVKEGEDWFHGKMPKSVISVRLGKKAYTNDFKERVPGHFPLFAKLKQGYKVVNE